MAERTEGSTDINATPEQIMDVLKDFDAYPDWAGIKKVEIKNKDSKGNPSEVYMEVSQMGMEAKYTLSYSYAANDGGMSWTTSEASGALKDLQGEYVLEPSGDGTKVTYQMAIEPAVRVPGFLKRQIEKQVVNTALGGLKKRVESR
ncbi:MAG: SRPBCC family protein [Actinomycetota bacterium]